MMPELPTSLKRRLKEITGIRDIERLLDKYYVIFPLEPPKETKRITRSSFTAPYGVARITKYKKLHL